MASLTQSGSYTRRIRRVTRKPQPIIPLIGGDASVVGIAATANSALAPPGIDATTVVSGGGPAVGTSAAGIPTFGSAATITATAATTIGAARTPAVTACSTYT